MSDRVSSGRSRIRLAAVGDLLLTPAPDGVPYARDHGLVTPAVRKCFAECDVVVGNLECTLPGNGTSVPSEPRVVATADLVRAVREIGVNLVTLGNNHAFDCLEPGFNELKSLLDDIGLPHFGAGMNLERAATPWAMQVGEIKLGFLCGVDERTGPSHLAGPNQFGVAPLCVDRLEAQIRELSADVHHVIVSLHWGDERFSIPSPSQIEQARRLVEAGASLILGHHPHVLQGTEIVGQTPIVYSMGNFFADEVYFSDGDAVRWNRTGRTGSIVIAEFSRDRLESFRQLATFDSGIAVDLDSTPFGQRRIETTSRMLLKGVSAGRYRQEHFRVNVLMPALKRLHWSNVLNLRPRHFAKAFDALFRSRSAGQ